MASGQTIIQGKGDGLTNVMSLSTLSGLIDAACTRDNTVFLACNSDYEASYGPVTGYVSTDSVGVTHRASTKVRVSWLAVRFDR